MQPFLFGPSEPTRGETPRSTRENAARAGVVLVDEETQRARANIFEGPAPRERREIEAGSPAARPRRRRRTRSYRTRSWSRTAT